jgi:hypothetical protein
METLKPKATLKPMLTPMAILTLMAMLTPTAIQKPMEMPNLPCLPLRKEQRVLTRAVYH